MYFRVAFSLFLFFGLVAPSAAQTSISTGWLASFNTFKLSSKWGIHLDVQARSTNELDQFQTLLFRPGINYQLKANQVLTAGYAIIPNRYNKLDDNELLPEHRLWQQFIVNQPVGHTAVQHRFRFEERFVPVPGERIDGDIFTDGHLFSTRFRYFVRSIIPLSQQPKGFEKGLFTALQNELFIHTSHVKHTNGKAYDQNRLYAALGYRISKGFDIEAGYMWQHVDRKGIDDLNNNVGQVAVYWRR